MEKRHKEILIQQRANLVENLNMRDGLYTQLITRKVLNQRMVRSIQNGRSLDQQAEELLNILPTRGREAFQKFCDALREDMQDEIVDLYLDLDPEVIDGKEDDKNSVQETGSSIGSEESQETLADTKCCKSQVDDIQASVLRSGGEVADVSKTVAPVGLSICEEFQQQTYRRSFEPSVVRTSQDNVDSVQSACQKYVEPHAVSRPVGGCSLQQCELDQQARMFYQNSMLHPENAPSAVFSVTNGQRLLTPSSLPYNILEKDSAQKVYSPVNPLLQRDSSLFRPSTSLPIKYESPVKDIIASQYIPSYHTPSSPLLNHRLSPYKDNIEQLQHSPHKIQPPSSPKVFKNIPGDLNGARVLERFEKHLGDNDQDSERGQILVRENLNHSVIPIQAESPLKNIENNFGTNVEFHRNNLHSDQENKILTQRQSYPTHASIEDHQPKYVNEREFMELQGYKELQSTNSPDKRELFSLPRHIERVFPDRASEELVNRGDNSVSRLARLDSVDTMNKRPFAEHQETKAKRLCQDRNTPPELTKPEKLTTLQVYDNVDNQVIRIPVIDEPKRQPAPAVVVIETHHDRHLTKVGGVMDDPEIDLTDGPVNVRVDVSTKQFYLANYKQAYPMRRIPRGKALILNVNEVVGKSPRRGTDIDRDNLHNLLCQLHYDVTVYNDSDGLTAKEMCLKLQQFSQHPGHQAAESTVVCILSHGEEGYIFGADGKKFELDAIFELFDNTSCRHLLGKPKIFIIQACRGGALDKGVTYSLDEHDGSDAKVRQVPSMSDMLICYPTQMGYYAWRNRDRGSWYVEALVQVFMKYAKCEDLCTMLNRVNLLVSKKVSHCPQIEMDQMSQMSEYKSTLRMPHLFFFPGIAGDLYR